MSALLKSISVLCSVLFVLPSVTVAQISVTSADILGLIGNSQSMELDTTGSIIVNVGSAGANQTWDFTSVTVQGFAITQNFTSPSGTPFESDFPSANFVISFADSFGGEGFGEIIIYEYAEVTSSGFANLGGGTFIPELDSSIVTFEVEDAVPLPLAFNSSWISTEADTFGDPATFATVSLDTTTNTVDAWGTLQLPIGFFDCLRLRGDNKEVIKTIIGGVVMSTEVTNTISYTWLSKDNFVIAQAESQDNDTDPNFGNASGFQRLVSLPTAVKNGGEQAQNPEQFELVQNYPNPFNPETLINYQTPEDGRVELTVHNLLGQTIRILVSENLRAGTHQIKWDGSDDFGNRVTSGLYLYRLKAGQFVSTKRMVLLQ